MKSPSARTLLVAAALCVAGSSSATAQGSAPSQAEQVPRFLRMSADASREPTLVNPSDSPVLNHRIAIDLRDVSAGTALREIAITAGIQFVYASDILPRGGAVRLQLTAGVYALFADTSVVLPGTMRSFNGIAVFANGLNHTVVVSAVDANYYQYYRTTSDPFSGATVQGNLWGAEGVFGSLVIVAVRAFHVATTVH